LFEVVCDYVVFYRMSAFVDILDVNCERVRNLMRSEVRETMSSVSRMLIEKIEALPAERIAEVEDFVEFLRLREEERSLTRSAAATSAPGFAEVWNNPEDDIYDTL
jgi:hypothetical protein